MRSASGRILKLIHGIDELVMKDIRSRAWAGILAPATIGASQAESHAGDRSEEQPKHDDATHRHARL